jgi:hypothetical protein
VSSLCTRIEVGAVCRRSGVEPVARIEPVYPNRGRSRPPPKRSRARRPYRACVPLSLERLFRRSGAALVALGRSSICLELRASSPPKRIRARSSRTSLSSPPEPDTTTGKPVAKSASAERAAQSEDIAVARDGSCDIDPKEVIAVPIGGARRPRPQGVVSLREPVPNPPEYCIRLTGRNPRELPPPPRLSGIPTWAVLPAFRS